MGGCHSERSQAWVGRRQRIASASTVAQPDTSCPSGVHPNAFEIKVEQPRQNRLIFHRGRVGIVPTVGRPYRPVERGVGVLEPARAGVVEVGQRALLQLGLGYTLSGSSQVRRRRSRLT